MRLRILMNDIAAGAASDGACGSAADCAAEELREASLQGVACVHGLSIYAETTNHTLLVDTGQDGRTWDNAAALGVSLADIGAVIVSHGHYDHSGGVMRFAAGNPEAPIYLNDKAGGDYWNLRDGATERDGARYIGIDRAILSLPQTRLLPGDRVTDIFGDGEVVVFGGATGRRLWPEGNRVLARRTEDGFIQDTFDHEQYVVLRDAGRTVLLGGCAHNGLLNILDRFHELFGGWPDAVVSGFHMMKQGAYTDAETATIRETAEELAKLPILYFTGHCTGLPAYEIMRPILGEALYYFGSGEEIVVREKDGKTACPAGAGEKTKH